MLYKLQRKTLPKAQLLGYSFALMISVALLGGIWQLYKDVKPLLEEQTDIFSSNYAVVSKPISAIGSLQKENIYFTPEEQEALQKESFVKSMAPFSVATFKIMAYTHEGDGELPLFATDLFFESIPDKYIDVKSDQWQWTPSRSFVPIIIPENYLSLYNFGFAQSQGLPVLSKGFLLVYAFQVMVRKRYSPVVLWAFQLKSTLFSFLKIFSLGQTRLMAPPPHMSLAFWWSSTILLSRRY